jgi:hypothetical protein
VGALLEQSALTLGANRPLCARASLVTEDPMMNMRMEAARAADVNKTFSDKARCGTFKRPRELGEQRAVVAEVEVETARAA